MTGVGSFRRGRGWYRVVHDLLVELAAGVQAVDGLAHVRLDVLNRERMLWLMAD